jgi:uncharacterized protein YbjT (DUF2867 family)
MSENIEHENRPLILITGASGYVGGRLLKALERQGKRLRCFARRPEFLKSRVAEATEIVKGDIFDTEALERALAGVHTAYYFVHTLAGKGSFEENDRRAAANFAAAARAANLKKIVYLGGLGEGDNLSHHLSSRQEVGEILRSSTVPTIEFRASIIIGSGSLSFEMVRALVQKLPIMTTPYWVRALAQPIAIEDVIAYLSEALDLDIRESTIFEIGGKDRVSYEQIMREYARVRKLKRLIIPLPFLTPWLSSLWLAFVTPLYFRVGRRLIEGVKNETLVKDNKAEKFFMVKPRGIREAIQRALENEDQEFAETRWSDALPLQALESHWGGIKFGSRLIDTRSVRVSFSPQEAFRPIQCVGGDSGWCRYDWLFHFRGIIDQLIGGVGRRRGRGNPRCLRVGDTVDFWRVEKLEQDKLIRLSAEMKVPGRAWLQYEVNRDDFGSVVRQTALFDPVGILGLIYWYSLYPFHQIIFKDMLQKIVSEMKELP